MTDILKTAKANLLSLLTDKNKKIIALTGKWGTGKTYLWNQIKQDLEPKNSAIYVSLFGVRTIDELKIRILQSSGSESFKNESAGVVANALVDVMKKFTGFSAKDAAMALLPSRVKNRLIVIDDIERKHKSLDIDEFLGMLDEYSEINEARFLIILNSDELGENWAIWARLHEKVIDAQLVFNPTSFDSFNIAAGSSVSDFLTSARDAIGILDVNNVRVIKRVLEVLEKIADVANSVGYKGVEGWVPSAVLLTVSHYHGIDNPPTFQFITTFSRLGYFAQNKNYSTEEQRWHDLILSLGIEYLDDFESIVQHYLLTGLLDEVGLSELFGRYLARDVREAAHKLQGELFGEFDWDVTITDEIRLSVAKDLIQYPDIFSYQDTAKMLHLLTRLNCNDLVACFVDRWCEHCWDTSRNALEELLSINQFEHPAPREHNSVHPQIIEKIKNLQDAKTVHSLTLLEAFQQFYENPGDLQAEAKLTDSTIDEYKEVLKAINNDRLKDFVLSHLCWLMDDSLSNTYKKAADNFANACLQICDKEDSSGLAKLIVREFQTRKIESRLISSNLQ
jgi:hypothetical protein